MKPARCGMAVVAVLVAFSVFANARDERVLAVGNGDDRIRFIVPEAVAIRVVVADSRGSTIFDSAWRDANIFDWMLLDADGHHVGAGGYIARTSIRALDGTVTVDERAVRVSGDEVIVEESDPSRSIMFVAHDAHSSSIVSTTSDVAFVFGDFLHAREREWMRLTTDGRLGIGTAAPQARLDVIGLIRTSEGVMFPDGSVQMTAGPPTSNRGGKLPASVMTAGAGTLGRIAKWTDNAGTLGDSTIREIGPIVTVGTIAAAGGVRIIGGPLQDVFAGMGLDVTNGPAMNYGYSGHTFGEGSGFFNVRPDANAKEPNPSLRFMTVNQQRMMIDNSGLVLIGSIGATDQPAAQLDIRGTKPASGREKDVFTARGGGGASSTTDDGGDGGGFELLAGNGGTSNQAGGSGGRFVQGAGDGASGATGGNGGLFQISAGKGGSPGGEGGSVYVQAGSAGAMGEAGSVYMSAGDVPDFTSGLAGNMYLDAGSNSLGAAGTIYLGKFAGGVAVGPAIAPPPGGSLLVQKQVFIGAFNGAPQTVDSPRLRVESAGQNLASFGATGRFDVDAAALPGGRFTVLDNGNVGIGKAAPNARLDVGAGDVRWSQSLLIDDQGGSLELGGTNLINGVGTPYIDFHNALGSNMDYSVRLLNDGQKQLTLIGDLHVTGDVNIDGIVTKHGGSFKIAHPLDPEHKTLSHSFVESPDMMNVYNGNVLLDERGEAVVELPSYFDALNGDVRYQLTAIGRPAPGLYVADRVKDNRFRIAGGAAGGEVSWQVTGVRHDEFANTHRIVVEDTVK
jgi:hypothetical protein